jgi:hypothetical protein
VRLSVSGKTAGESEIKAGNGTVLKAAFLAAAVLAAAGIVFYFGTAVHSARASGPGSLASGKPSPKSLSMPFFFEPNQGQTAPQVKFLARGSGYGLFLTADEAVLQLQRPAVSTEHSAASSQLSVPGFQRASSSVIRMRIDGANASARISGAAPLTGKSNYFIGNDPAKWRHNIPQFARVEYKSVYPGIDLVYYGDQGQLEYDFRVAPAADPNQIALSFEGASARIDSGDLVLSTGNGDVRFHAPRIYQPAAPESGNSSGTAEKAIAGSFRQLADNKVGFTIGDYDHGRELVIDPVLTYSTYLGGSLKEEFVQVAVDPAGLIYVAGSTTSTNFPLPMPPNVNNPPYQSSLPGTENIFIAVLNTTPLPNNSQLAYATYLGGSQTDLLAGLAVSTAIDHPVSSGVDVYVAGTTTSPDFPTNGAFAPFEGAPQTGTHGFLARLNIGTSTLRYSTYLAGNGMDTITGLAIDSNQNAFVTGVTTSTNPASAGFPANPNGYQICPYGPILANGSCPSIPQNAPPQFFASKIYTAAGGSASMLYSTYFGGSIPASATAVGGGIAVDPPPASNVNMYITGTTNMLPGTPGVPGFPLLNAYQSCLDQPSQTSCNGTTSANTDAFVAKINPNQVSTSSLIYSTYVGSTGNETGTAIAVDTSANAYITGSTNSNNWPLIGTPFQNIYGGGVANAFIVKIGNLTNGQYPLNYFTYLGGNGYDIGEAIQVDAVQSAHVAGTTTSTNFPTTADALYSSIQGKQNAFVASISSTTGGTQQSPMGDFSTYLGGNQFDQGTGVAIDVFGATYVGGNTTSTNFPVTVAPNPNAFQSMPPGSPSAFVSRIGSSSQLVLTNSSTSPSPSPVAAGTQAAFTFNILNMGPDNAYDVNFTATVPTTGLASDPTAKVTSGSGTCGAVTQSGTITCTIPTLQFNSTGMVEVDLTPAITTNGQNNSNTTVTVSAQATANNSPVQGTASQTDDVVDFTVTASPLRQTINAGDLAVISVVFSPTTSQGYSASITPSQTTSPTMVTAGTPIYTPTTVTLSGSAPGTTTLNIQTVPRPVTTGGLLRRGSFYATWLPIGGLSLIGLGIGASRKRRRWLAAAALGLIAGIILLQPGCGSRSTSTTTTGGTLAGTYTVTIVGSAGTGASHNYQVVVQVN